MARNKHPEETVKLILDTATRLFISKGFEKTSLQDIIDETGLSKGAIYYHFGSKEDIFEKVCAEQSTELMGQITSIRDDASMNGREKLKAILKSSVTNPDQIKLIDFTPNLLENPKFLASIIKEIYELSVPKFLEPVIKQGIEDGSIKTKYPKEAAEAILVLSNIWLSPVVYPGSTEVMGRKIEIFDTMLKAIGIDIMDDEIKEIGERFCSLNK